jgi:hypothetical protein
LANRQQTPHAIFQQDYKEPYVSFYGNVLSSCPLLKQYISCDSVIMNNQMNNLATVLIPLLILHANLSTAFAALGNENHAVVPLEKEAKIWEDVPKPKERIVGGETAVAGAYPFFAQWMSGCGGSLIHDDIVLTAGASGIVFRAAQAVFVCH